MTTHVIRATELHAQRSGAGRTMIWGHGLTMSRAADDDGGMIDWSQVPADVVRYDARGHGLSTTTPELHAYGWDQLALDQLALADALGVERYVAGGASMGCATALHAAVASPERIERLILMIPPTGWETRAAQADIYRQSADVVEAEGVEPMIRARRALAPPDPFVGDEDFQTRRDANLRSWDTGRLVTAMRGAAGADLPSREQISALRQPALILAWTGDPGHPQTTAEELDRLMPNATLHLASTRADVDRWTHEIADFIA